MRVGSERWKSLRWVVIVRPQTTGNTLQIHPCATAQPVSQRWNVSASDVILMFKHHATELGLMDTMCHISL